MCVYTHIHMDEFGVWGLGLRGPGLKVTYVCMYVCIYDVYVHVVV